MKRMIKEIIIISIMALLIIGVTLLSKNNNTIERQCDKEKGRTCTYYEVRQFELNR